MGKHGLSLAELKEKKRETFFKKVSKWVTGMSLEDRKRAYHALLLFSSEQIPLIHQDEVIQKAQDLYKIAKVEGR